MRANIKDRQQCVKIITKTFKGNPSVNVVIGKNGNSNKKITRLAEYAYVKAQNRDGVYISENKLGTALFFRSDLNKTNFKEVFYELKFALVIPLKNVFKTLKRESFYKSIRPFKSYYYFWFLGVKNGGDKAVYELKDEVFKKATSDKLPILLETSVERNVKAYERYGFEVYHTWNDEENGITVWFMKWES